MTKQIFTDKNITPDETSFKKALGDTGPHLDEIRKYLADNHGTIKEEWKCYGKHGWQLKMLLKKRNLLFLLPFEGWFKIVFVYGDKAVKAAEESDIPREIITELLNARKYMEGRGVAVEVRSAVDAETIKKMLKIKIEN